MNWNKQSYLSVNEIGNKIRNQKVRDKLYFAEKIINSSSREYRFWSKGGRIDILLELSIANSIILYIDDAILDVANTSLVTSSVDLLKGEHIVKLVFDTSSSTEVKLTIEGLGIKKSGDYRLSSYDYINKRVMIKDSKDTLYYVDIDSAAPSLKPHEMFSCSRLEYYHQPYDDYIEAEAYLIRDGLGTLYWMDEGIEDIIEHNVSAVALLEAIDSSYDYIIAYLKNGIIYYRMKYPSHQLTIVNVVCDDIYSEMVSISSHILCKNSNGEWDIIKPIKDSPTTVYLVREHLRLRERPSIDVQGSEITLYPKDKGFYYDSNDKALTNADVMAFYGNKVLLVWDDKARIIDKEMIIC